MELCGNPEVSSGDQLVLRVISQKIALLPKKVDGSNVVLPAIKEDTGEGTSGVSYWEKPVIHQPSERSSVMVRPWSEGDDEIPSAKLVRLVLGEGQQTNDMDCQERALLSGTTLSLHRLRISEDGEISLPQKKNIYRCPLIICEDIDDAMCVSDSEEDEEMIGYVLEARQMDKLMVRLTVPKIADLDEERKRPPL